MSSLNASCKKCRREGVKLYLKGDRCYTKACAVERRNTVPGMHGATTQRKLSDYGQQLREKQKLKRMYGMREKQFSLAVKEAVRLPGVTGENLLVLLELRLDNIAYRLGWTSSRAQSRQFVGHGHLLVNGKRVDIPSYKVKAGDVIEVAEKSKDHKHLKECIEKTQGKKTPGWLSVDCEAMKGTVLNLPTRADIDTEIQEQLIVEYYSR